MADVSGTVRARAGALIPQPGGGALMPPWPKGSSGMTGFRSTKRRATALLNEGTVDASRRLIALCGSDDERVAVVAVNQLLDRTVGKPSELPQGDDGAGGQLDLSCLSSGDRDKLIAALATIQRIRAIAVSLAANRGKGVDGQGDDG